MRHVGIRVIHLFSPFPSFHQEITISRSLEGKYTFWEDLLGIQGDQNQ